MTSSSALLVPAAALDLDARAAFCVALARSAGEIAREGFAARAAAGPDAGIGMKGPQDFLTETDTAVERHIKARLAESFPEDGFLGEETGGTVEGHVWVVDPIDGTANFARAIPHFCISIAFVADGEIEHRFVGKTVGIHVEDGARDMADRSEEQEEHEGDGIVPG